MFFVYCLHSPVSVQYVCLNPTNVTVLTDYNYYVFLKSTLCSLYEECGFQSYISMQYRCFQDLLFSLCVHCALSMCTVCSVRSMSVFTICNLQHLFRDCC